MEAGICRSCKAPIWWVRTAATGSLMPLDREPVAEGNVIVKDGVAHTLRGDLFEEMADGPHYMPHHATCPNAAQHRKEKPQKKEK